MKRWAGTCSLIACLALAAPAGAAMQLGETFAPNACSDPSATRLQVSSPGNLYTAGFRGVITSWSYRAGSPPSPVKFKVARSLGGNQFQIVGESALHSPTANSLLTVPAQIPVLAGDVIGIYLSQDACGRSALGTGYSARQLYPGDPPTGSTNAYSTPFEFQLDVAATLEPDCDGDGLGDETQDAEISAITACDPVAPDTTITKQPKAKTKKKQAEFEFTSSEPGSSFECALDGSAFAACTSPLIRKVGKGKHVFQVRSVDAAGNVDGSPALAEWKVKKKKR